MEGLEIINKKIETIKEFGDLMGNILSLEELKIIQEELEYLELFMSDEKLREKLEFWRMERYCDKAYNEMIRRRNKKWKK